MVEPTPEEAEKVIPYPRANWRMEPEPHRIVTDPYQVNVVVDKEVKRFRIYLRMGSQGMSLKLTCSSSEKVRREVEKAGAGSYYEFSETGQGYPAASIMSPVGTETLANWAMRTGAARGRIYVGLVATSVELPRVVFVSVEKPTEETHGNRYACTIGPFDTLAGAEYMSAYGAGNPHCQTVEDAERLAAELQEKGRMIP